jgi:arylsulfatase A-like enzyme
MQFFRFSLVAGCVLALATGAFSQAPKPNIIYLLADDLGYGDLGSYGQKLIRTPRLDRMAQEGMRFTQHYAGAPSCR